VIPITDTEFSETFTANPAEGYQFVKWANGDGFGCPDSISPICELSFASEALPVGTGAAIVASSSSGYIMPIFEELGTDTGPVDSDGDGVANTVDNCPSTQNASQTNIDDDLRGDACDPFPNDPNEWSDGDADGIGDNSDECGSSELNELVNDVGCPDVVDGLDSDGDGVADVDDSFPNVSLGGLRDSDRDGIPDVCNAACVNAGMEQDICHIEDGDDSGQIASACYPVTVDYALPDIILGDSVCPIGTYPTIDTDGDNIKDAGCINPTYAVLNPPYYQPKAWSGLTFSVKRITIPKGKILAMPFETLDWDGYVAKLSFVVPTNEPGAVASVWVSLAKGGAPIDSDCMWGPASENYTLRYSTYASNVCSLEPSAAYYLNMAHTRSTGDVLEPLQNASVMKRSIYHLVLPPTE